MRKILCKTCSSNLEIRYYRKYGVLLLLSCLPMIPILFFIAYGTLIPYLYLLFSISVSLYLFFKKEKYFYFCKSCKAKISRHDIEENET